MIRLGAALLAVSLITASHSARAAALEDAQKLKDQLTGDAAGTASDNAQCRLFKPTELEPYIGEPVNAGQNAAMGTGCQWTATDDSGDILIQIVPAEYLPYPSLADGFVKRPDLGEKGYVYPDLGGFIAGAIVGTDGVIASVAGEKASPDNAVALFRELVRRRGS